MNPERPDLDIAIVGFAGRFPGARNCDALWKNLVERTATAVRFSRDELIAAGVPTEQADHPSYVPVNHPLGAADRFDAELFGIPAQEAEILDPQQRIFLEITHEALEHAGYGGGAADLAVGVFAGAGLNTYLLENLAPRYRVSSSVDRYQLMIANDKDYLATRVAFKLGLTGPAISVSTACSTSLVAVHLACASLQNGECDLALAGAAHVRARQRAGYLYQEGMIFSADGCCRAFDRRAGGTILGDGAGAVVLKRLADALEDGDTIHAVVKGSAINNDGARKIGYTAPSVEGQAEAIAEAQRLSGVDAASVSYVETHGTGTFIGDPVEIAGLTAAFRRTTDKTGYCAIGSVKTNLGHLDVAAGIAGLIKTVLMLKAGTLVPSLHFEAPNPEIDFAASPFRVQTEVAPWAPVPGAPRRAGVSAFGIGGTNAHVVLEEAPAAAPRPSSATGPELLPVSGATAEALETATSDLARFLRRTPGLDLADAAHTLACGRGQHPYRRIALARDARGGALALALADGSLTAEGHAPQPQPIDLAIDTHLETATDFRALIARVPTFARALEACAEAADGLGVPVRGLFAKEAVNPSALAPIQARAAGFAARFAEARMWLDWGLAPRALRGIGRGTAVVAALTGELSLPRAIAQALAEDVAATPGTADPADPAEAAATLAIGARCAPGEAIAPLAGAATELERVLSLLGALWLRGVEIDWEAVYAERGCRRIPLPAYPYQHKRYWIEPAAEGDQPQTREAAARALLQAIEWAAPSARKGVLVAHLQEKVRGMLDAGAPLPDPAGKLLENPNLNSLMLVELVADLSLRLNVPIKASALVEHPSIDAFAEHAIALLGLGAAPQSPAAEPAETTRRDLRDGLAAQRRRLHRETAGGSAGA